MGVKAMDAEAFRALVAAVEQDPELLANLIIGGATDPRLVELLPESRLAANSGSVAVGALIAQRLVPETNRRRRLLEIAGASCDGNVTCCCTSSTCGGVTCGGSTCDVTCSGDSCGNTCGDSCGMTTNFDRSARVTQVRSAFR